MFYWTEDLSVGDEKIDVQHKELFERAEAVLTANGQDSVEMVTKALDFLAYYVIEHFSFEEAFMIRNHYENFKEHRDRHSYFVKEIYDLSKKVRQEAVDNQLVNSLKVLMLEWLVNHINEDDRKLAQVVRENG